MTTINLCQFDMLCMENATHIVRLSTDDHRRGRPLPLCQAHRDALEARIAREEPAIRFTATPILDQAVPS
jgi:hypothetical protein